MGGCAELPASRTRYPPRTQWSMRLCALYYDVFLFPSSVLATMMQFIFIVTVTFCFLSCTLALAPSDLFARGWWAKSSRIRTRATREMFAREKLLVHSRHHHVHASQQDGNISAKLRGLLARSRSFALSGPVPFYNMHGWQRAWQGRSKSCAVIDYRLPARSRCSLILRRYDVARSHSLLGGRGSESERPRTVSYRLRIRLGQDGATFPARDCRLPARYHWQ